jgi:dihydrofolate reductase
MGAVTIMAAVSLDGFIADENDAVGPLFDWYYNGDTEVTFADEERVFHTTAETAEFLRKGAGDVACIVEGRRLFDITDGWHGRPAAGEHVFVVTHEPPTDWPYADTAPFTFVTEGVAAAVEQAKAFAGDRDVAVTAGDIGGQALRLGLVDRVILNLVPAVFGTGVPFFGRGAVEAPMLFEDPRVVQGSRVTHLVYDARR